MVDKNLFLYDLAVVAIMKNEGHYLKEWLDYHLLAGVDHFYLYDNESPDNQAEVVAPYVEAGLVDYFTAPGKAMQYVVYNDAVKRFKFQCRYMAFIDGDEFIYPKTRQSIVEVLDEIFSQDICIAGLAIHWQLFGSNGQDKADYSRGVLERFTRRAPKDYTPGGMGNAHVKIIANPRMINCMAIAHFAVYFEGVHAINENGQVVAGAFNNPVTAQKIVVNHYHTKSFEEYKEKIARGKADLFEKRTLNEFKSRDRNEEFDDGILKYRDTRADSFTLESNEDRFNRVTAALIETLSQYTNGRLYNLETTLTCRALSTYLRENFPNDADYWRICEQASIEAILKSLRDASFTGAQLLIRDLPNLLAMPYPEVKKLRSVVLHIIPQMMNLLRDAVGSSKHYGLYRNFVELDYLQDLLKLI